MVLNAIRFRYVDSHRYDHARVWRLVRRPDTPFNTSNLSCKIAGFISHEETDELYLDRNSFLDNREINRNDRFIQYGLIAAKLAIEDANLLVLSDESKNRTGV